MKDERIERLAKYIIHGRGSIGFTQRQLAEAVGVTHTYISKIENRKVDRMPSIQFVRSCVLQFGDSLPHVFAQIGLVDLKQLALCAQDSYWIALLLNRIASGAVTANNLVALGVFAPTLEPEDA